MKKVILKFASAALFAAALFLTACGGSAAQQGQDQAGETATEQTEEAAAPAEATESDAEMGPEYTSAYVCPMHCKGSGSDEPGNCPVCGMAYVALADHEGDGHKH